MCKYSKYCKSVLFSNIHHVHRVLCRQLWPLLRTIPNSAYGFEPTLVNTQRQSLLTRLSGTVPGVRGLFQKSEAWALKWGLILNRVLILQFFILDRVLILHSSYSGHFATSTRVCADVHDEAPQKPNIFICSQAVLSTFQEWQQLSAIKAHFYALSAGGVTKSGQVCQHWLMLYTSRVVALKLL